MNDVNNEPQGTENENISDTVIKDFQSPDAEVNQASDSGVSEPQRDVIFMGNNTEKRKSPFVDRLDFFKKLSGNMKIIISVVIILVVSVVIFLFTGRSYEKVIDEYMKAALEGDTKKVMSLMPKESVEFLALDDYEGEKNELFYDVQDKLSSMLSKLEERHIDTAKISYTIVSESNISVDSEISDMNAEGIDLDVKEAKKVTVKVRVPTVDPKNIYFPVVKIGRSWYILNAKDISIY